MLKIKCTSKSSWLTWKPLSKLERRWHSDLRISSSAESRSVRRRSTSVLSKDSKTVNQLSFITVL